MVELYSATLLRPAPGLLTKLSSIKPCAVARRLTEAPLTIMVMLLSGAGAAKSGHGIWAAGGILTLLPIYFGALVTCLATRSVANWVARIHCHETCQTTA